MPQILANRLDTHWRDGANCRSTVTTGADDVWFTADSELARERGYPENVGRASALALCRACPVIEPCLAFALRIERDGPERARAGIFGGTTPQQRRLMAAPRPD
jgi:hypothetical protein